MAAADVGNLSWDVDKENLAEHFSQFGEVRGLIVSNNLLSFPPLITTSHSTD